MPFNTDDPWTSADTLHDLCNCGGNQTNDPTNPDWHHLDCGGLPTEATE